MSISLVDSGDVCRRIMEEQSVLLDTRVTGQHYQLSDDIHTDNVYLFAPIMAKGQNRVHFGRKIVEGMFKSDIDPRREVDILLGTGIAAMPLVYTLQHFPELEHTEAMYMERRNGNGELALGAGFSLQKDKRVFLVHLAAISFDRIRETIRYINTCALQSGVHPCVQGFAVLIDRSPEGSSWREDLRAFRSVIGMRSPISAYPADPEKCLFCVRGVPLSDLRGIA